MMRREIVICLSDERGIKLTDRWYDDTRCWEWDRLLDCMRRGGIYITPSGRTAINTARIATAELRMVDE